MMNDWFLDFFLHWIAINWIALNFNYTLQRPISKVMYIMSVQYFIFEMHSLTNSHCLAQILLVFKTNILSFINTVPSAPWLTSHITQNDFHLPSFAPPLSPISKSAVLPSGCLSVNLLLRSVAQSLFQVRASNPTPWVVVPTVLLLTSCSHINLNVWYFAQLI